VSLKGTGVVLARNTLYNIATQAAVSVVAFLSIPAIIRGMGAEAFGVLTLFWMIVGYFSILDLGVGQASVKFLAEHIARGETREANSTLWVSVVVSGVLGVLTSVVLLCLVPFLLEGILAVPAGLREETRRAFYWIAAAIPFVMLQSAFRSVPMAVQRFDLFNLMQGVSGLLQWGGSLLLVVNGFGLLEVVFLTVAIRVLGAAVAWAIAARLFPRLSFRRPADLLKTARILLRFGGWFTISQAVSPVTRYLDRVIVVSYQSLAMFTYYAAPFEAISRLQVIPLSLSTTLFPAMSERESIHGPAESHSLYMRAINVTVLLMLPVTIVLIIFSRPLLQLWLGGDFPSLSSGVFQILAAAVLVQAICYVPLTSLLAQGKPDIAAKYYLVEIPLYAGLCLLLIPSMGILGAAWAYCIRMVISTAWFLWRAHRALGSPPTALMPLVKSLGVNVLVLASLVAVAQNIRGVPGQLIAMCAVAAGYGVAVWMVCLDRTEKEVIRTVCAAGFGLRKRARGG
jgi:O-antigen/teichoic acid export membrane protein